MTALLDRAVTAPIDLSRDAKDDIAHVLMRLATADHQAPVPLAAEEDAALAGSIAAAQRGEFAADEDVPAVWAKHDL